MKETVTNAHKNGIWVGICGELGADLALTETFLAMGLNRGRVTVPLFHSVPLPLLT